MPKTTTRKSKAATPAAMTTPGLYTGQYAPTPTPATAPLPGRAAEMKPSYQGGFVFQVDDQTQLDRFLTLGLETTSIYLGPGTRAKMSDALIRRLIANGQGAEIVERACVVSEQGRAIRQEPALFALAVCATSKNAVTKRAAWANYRRAVRTGYHLFLFFNMIVAMNGGKSNRSLRTGIAAFYEDTQPFTQLAYQVVKYQSRTVEGKTWSHRDLLRIAHPNPGDSVSRKILFNWIAKGWESVGDEPHPLHELGIVWAFEKAKKATTAKEVIQLIADYRLTREMLPTQWLADPDVLTALLQNMPMTAMLRNLGSMTARGILDPMSDNARLVADRLQDATRVKNARLHPLTVLAAQRQYATGRGDKGSHTWTPNTTILGALDQTFYLGFDAVEPTDLRILNCVDCSGSMMGSSVGSLPLTAREVAVVQAMVSLRREPNSYCVGYTTRMIDLPLTAAMSLESALQTVDRIAIPEGTDCSLPMLWAAERHMFVDAFVQYTDNEHGSGFGTRHPADALTDYRKAAGLPTSMVIVAMDATSNSIGDPKDARTLNIAGASTDLPAVITDFITGGTMPLPAETDEED